MNRFKIFYIFLSLNYYALSLSVDFKESKLAKGAFLTGSGFGWDYLTAEARYPVQKISYDQNKKTSDNKYLVPDCMEVEDVKRTKYSDLAEIIEKASRYFSITSKSIKVSASFAYGNFSAGGSYSKDFFQMIEEQRNSSTVTARTKYLDHRYTLITSNRCPLNQNFIAAVEDLLLAIEFDIPDLAAYMAEALVADFGTHIVKRAKIGGTIYADDYLDEEYYLMFMNKTQTVQFAASVSFDSTIKANASFSSSTTVSNEDYNTYRNRVNRTFIDAYGGAYIPGMTVSRWAETLDFNLAPIDREADLLHNVMVFSNFPSKPPLNVYKASTYIQAAIASYLNENSINGCMDRNSINYDPMANFDPGNACEEQVKFGGVLSSSCFNPFGNQNCPVGFIEKPLIMTAYPSISMKECVGGSTIKQSSVLFGGIYSSMANNPVTGGRSCPPGFLAQSIFECSNNFMCISMDIAKGVKYAVPFGGFISTCFTNTPYECPKGLEKKLVNVIKGCEISYCTKIKNYSRPQLKRLPYKPKPPSYNHFLKLKKNLNI